MVWPALLPPWKRITTSAVSASRSVTLPFPSSPHWAPTITSPGMSSLSLGSRDLPEITAHYRNRLTAHSLDPRDRAEADLLAQLVEAEIGGDHDRALVLPALVDDRVELLEDPLGALLGAEVVEVEQVHLAQPAEQLGVRAPGVVLVGLLDVGEQPRHRVDGHAAAGLERGLGHQHRERGLARADVPEEPQPVALVDVLLDAVHELPDPLDHEGIQVDDRLAVERHAAEALRNTGADAAAL